MYHIDFGVHRLTVGATFTFLEDFFFFLGGGGEGGDDKQMLASVYRLSENFIFSFTLIKYNVNKLWCMWLNG